MNTKFTGRYRNNAVTTMSTAKYEYGGGMINSARDNYRSRTPMNGRTDVSGNRLENRSGSMSKFKHLATVNQHISSNKTLTTM